MSMEKQHPSIYLTISIIFLSITSNIEGLAFRALSRNATLVQRYIDEERKALLNFRATFSSSDTSNRFSSWNNTDDCCTRRGVGCDKISGHIIKLDLGYSDVKLSYLEAPNLDSSILGLKYLSYLDLSGCDFRFSPIPLFVGSMKHLRYLNLSFSRLGGVIPRNLGDVLGLRRLDLSHNVFSGLIPHSLSKLSFLERLDLSSNNLSGSIPSSFGNLSSLTNLILFENQLSGELPISLGKLSNLERVDVNFNSLRGTLSERFFDKLSKLKYLKIGYNSFKLGVARDWVPPFRLEGLDLRYCDIGGEFPQWLQTQKELRYLVLANSSISGTLPLWLSSLNLTHFFLSQTQLSGPIPKLPSTLQSLHLTQNLINGTIPHSLCEIEGLEILDLSENHLSGDLPDCWAKLRNLFVLRLSSNDLSGVIPSSIGGVESLRWLHLNNNSFIGELPITLTNCKNLIVLDIGENIFHGKLPKWIGKNLLELKVLRLRNNNFYGTIPLEVCRLVHLRVMDLANNGLVGEIPNCIGDFSGMVGIESNTSEFVKVVGNESYYESLSQMIKGLDLQYTKTSGYVVNLDLSKNNLIGRIPLGMTNLSALIGLNLSCNHLTGEIPEKIGEMKSLESLDLSCNDFLGRIPESLSMLTSLGHLNFSGNNLSGPIPKGNQLQTLDDPSIYDGNPQLCGFPLVKRCGEGKGLNLPNLESGRVAEDKEDKLDKIWFSGFVISGFATGFWGVIGGLILKKRWRQAYFKFFEVSLWRFFKS